MEERDGYCGQGFDAGFEGGFGVGFEVAGVGAGEGFAGGFGGGEAVGVHGSQPVVDDGDLMAFEAEDADVFAGACGADRRIRWRRRGF